MRKKRSWIILVSMLLVSLLLQACASDTLRAPCDNYGRNCDPKIKINQWTDR